MRFSPLDVKFLGHPNVIASCLLEGPGGAALIDPGPASSLQGLEAALAAHGRTFGDIDTILLTHIHLDHAGGTGTIVRANPRVRVYVHERGAPHVVDPTKLLDSASRLYGDQMQRLWGEVAPVPQPNVEVLRGGESIQVAGGCLQVAYTPGHASHHVSYFDPDARTAFVGDTAGIRIGNALMVVPPTPPPDVNLEAWEVSIEKIRAWNPDRLFLTHFGAFERPSEHLADLRARTREQAALVQASLDEANQDDEERMARFAREVTESIGSRFGAELAATIALAVPFEHCWMGLARYFRKKQANQAVGADSKRSA